MCLSPIYYGVFDIVEHVYEHGATKPEILRFAGDRMNTKSFVVGDEVGFVGVDYG